MIILRGGSRAATTTTGRRNCARSFPRSQLRRSTCSRWLALLVVRAKTRRFINRSSCRTRRVELRAPAAAARWRAHGHFHCSGSARSWTCTLRAARRPGKRAAGAGRRPQQGQAAERRLLLVSLCVQATAPTHFRCSIIDCVSFVSARRAALIAATAPLANDTFT